VGNELEIKERKSSLVSGELDKTGNEIVNLVKGFRQKYRTIFEIWDKSSKDAGLNGEAYFDEQVEIIFEKLVKETIPNGVDQLKILQGALNDIQDLINGLEGDINLFDENTKSNFTKEINTFNSYITDFKTNYCKLS
jgi:hypothetical protein